MAGNRNPKQPGCRELKNQSSRAWRVDSLAGLRWGALVAALQNAQPVEPTVLARLYRAIAELEAGDVSGRVSERDHLCLAVLTSLPNTPVPLSTAMRICADPDGYVSAAAQSTFLEGFGGASFAAAAHAMAADLQAALQPQPPPACPAHAPQTSSRRFRRGRRGRPAQVADRDGSGHSEARQDDELPRPAQPAVEWEQLDATDLAADP
ncbi:unnamed protein product, partial [Symbiodinium pilosum]